MGITKPSLKDCYVHTKKEKETELELNKYIISEKVFKKLLSQARCDKLVINGCLQKEVKNKTFFADNISQ